MSADGQDRNGCSLDAMPEARKVCRNPSCEYMKKIAAGEQRSRLSGLDTGQLNASQIPVLGMARLDPVISKIWP